MELVNKKGEMIAEIKLSLQKAYAFCEHHREENKVRIFSQCWGCVKYSKEDPEKMCFYDPPNDNACKFVNRQAEKESTSI